MLVVAMLLIMVAAVPLIGVRLDMSMRPFNSNDPVEVAITSHFEEHFGQRLGAYTGVIIEDDSILSTSFLDDLESLSSRLERLEHVSEVVSLVRFSIPDWTRGGRVTAPLSRSVGGWVYDGLPDYKSPIESRAEQVFDEIRYPPTRLQRMELKYLASLARDSLKTPPASRVDSIRSDPRLKQILLSNDVRMTLVLARFDLPLRDPRRAEVIDSFESEVVGVMGKTSRLRFVGYTHVEREFSWIVLLSLAQTFLLTFLVIKALLWVVYGRIALVLVALTGVTLATLRALAGPSAPS